MTRLRLAVAVVMTMWIAFAGAAATKAADQTAAELAQSLQRRNDAIRDFSADFVHSYKGGV